MTRPGHPVEYDLALTEDRTGKVLLHRAMCPSARLMADLGFPVLSMYGCAEIPEDLPWHECLEGYAAQRHVQGDQS